MQEGGISVQEAEQKPEQSLTSREEARLKLRDAGDIIRKHLNQGVFGEEGGDKDTKAQTALLYQGTEGSSTKEASIQLQAMIASVREIAGKDPQAQELSDYFAEKIKVFNLADGQIYSLSEWEKQLSAIQNNDSLSEDEKESKTKELEEKAFRGFLLQKETETQEQPKLQADSLIADQIIRITQEIEQSKGKGENTGERESVLESLKLAKQADGDVGIFFKADVLQRLKASGVEDVNRGEIDRALEELNPRLKKAEDTFRTHLEKYGISAEQQKQIVDIVQTADIEKLITNEYFNKIKDLDQLIFGKKITGQELLEMLSSQEKAMYLLTKYGKKGLWGILLMLLLGAVQTADFAKGEFGAR